MSFNRVVESVTQVKGYPPLDLLETGRLWKRLATVPIGCNCEGLEGALSSVNMYLVYLHLQPT